MLPSLVGRAFRRRQCDGELARARSATAVSLGILLCAMPASIAAQQPPRAGANGVPVPALQTFVAPVYPAVALLDQPLWVVKAEAIIRADGRVESVRIADPQVQVISPPTAGRKPPDPADNEVNRSVLDAVKQWVFMLPMVNGAVASVVVPITVRFEVFSAPEKSFFTATLPVAEMPSDFSMVYTQGFCTLDTRAGLFKVAAIGSTPAESRRLVLRGDELDSIYQEMRRVQLFEYPQAIYASYERGPSSQRDATWAITSDGLLVVMRLENSGPMVRQSSALHRFEVRQNGTVSTVTWEDTYSGASITRELEGIRAVINVVKRILERHQELRDIEAVAAECRPQFRDNQ
jgi:hypothetical protein